MPSSERGAAPTAASDVIAVAVSTVFIARKFDNVGFAPERAEMLRRLERRLAAAGIDVDTTVAAGAVDALRVSGRDVDALAAELRTILDS